MIRIVRPPTAPAVLSNDGVAQRAEHEREVAGDPDAFAAGKRTLAFARGIYAHVSVKQALLAMQHDKCAFCEAKPLHVSDGDVEHFRPKAAVRQSVDDELERPGYYWLAYDWPNLLFACERCNRRHKRNEFPLATRSGAGTAQAVASEQPLFIDPSAEDPTPFITYREHVPIAVGGDGRGERTIESLGLRRVELQRDREEHLERLKLLRVVATSPEVPQRLRDEAAALIARSMTDAAEYASMCRAAFGA